MVFVHHGDIGFDNLPECVSAESAEINALATAAERQDDPLVACCNLEAAFLPESVFREAEEHHQKQGFEWTAVTGLPEGVALNLYSRAFLLRLRDLQMPDKPSDPLSLIERLSSESLFQTAMLARDATPPIRSGLFIAQLESAPRSLHLRSAADTVVARQAIEGANGTAGSLLKLWAEFAASPTVRPVWQPLERNQEKLRVLFFSNHSGYSGAEEALAETVLAIDGSHTEKLAFVPMEGRFSDRMAAAGCQLYHWAEDLSEPSMSNILVLTELLKALKPDVIHLNSYCGLPILAAALHAETPIVQHLRVTSVERFEDAMTSANAVVAVSSFVRNRTFGLRMSPDKVTTIFDGVDCERFNRLVVDGELSRARWNIDPEQVVILFAARLDRHKRADLLLKAVRILAERHPNVVALIAGDDSVDPTWTAWVDQYVAENNLARNVKRIGFQSDMLPVYAASDILVSCSEGEALGCSVLEAMAMSIPVVVSDNGGTVELVTPGETGSTFSSGSASALADALRPLVKARTLRDAMGAKARRKAEAEFSILAAANSLEKVLFQVAGRSK